MSFVKRTVRPENIPLTTSVFNVLIKEAYRVTADPLLVIADHDWLQNALAQKPKILPNPKMHQEAIAHSFESALSMALYGQPAEELAKPKSDAHVLDAKLPETLGELKERVVENVEYAKASLSQIKGLEPASQEYALNIYVALQSDLFKMAETLQLQPRAKSVHNR